MTQVWSLGQKDPWRRKWQPTSVFLPMKSHGQRSLVDYSLWGSKRIRHDLMTKWQQQGMLTKGYTVYKKISNNTVELDLNQKNTLVFPVAQQVKKNLPAVQERQANPWVGKIPWRRKWQPTTVFQPEKSHGQGSLEFCSS